jgi:hypothetical protein
MVLVVIHVEPLEDIGQRIVVPIASHISIGAEQREMPFTKINVGGTLWVLGCMFPIFFRGCNWRDYRSNNIVEILLP